MACGGSGLLKFPKLELPQDVPTQFMTELTNA
jgi:hypothetical protein